MPAVLGNDADVAGLAEALFGAGKGLSPIFYITIGSGIGGGLIIDGEIYRGTGRGAAEIGHLRMPTPDGPKPLELVASGWAIQEMVRDEVDHGDRELAAVCAGPAGRRGRAHDRARRPGRSPGRSSGEAWRCVTLAMALGEGIAHVIALLCPRRIVLGGGVLAARGRPLARTDARQRRPDRFSAVRRML